MTPHSSLRASDADREAAAERLRHAAGEGRLEPDELEERLHAALRARTYGDVQRLLNDLPASPIARERRRAEVMPAARTALAVAMRVVLTLAVVAVVLTVVAAMSAWWIVWAVVWFGLRGRRFSGARVGARSWGCSPRPYGVQRGRQVGLR
jgi:hypothetical protein